MQQLGEIVALNM